MRPTDHARLLLLAAIWGASFLFMRVTAPVIGAVPTAFWRLLLGAAGLAGALALQRTRWQLAGRWRPVLVLGILNFGLPFLLYAFAAQRLPAGYSAIFNATTPLMGVLIGWACFGQAPTLASVLGVLLGLGGVAVLTATGPVAFTPGVLAAALACLLATACYGLGGFLTQRWINDRRPLDPKQLAFGSEAGATLFLLPFFVGDTVLVPHAAAITAGVALALAGLGLLCTAWAYALYFRLIADIGPTRTFSVALLIPPFGVLWGVLFLGERLSAAHAVGGGLVLLALVLVLRRKPP